MLLFKLFKITDKSYLSALSQAGTIGLHMVSGVAVGSVIGYLLDRWLETHPWCTIIFLLVGIVAGFKNVYVDTKRLIATQKEEDQNLGRSKDQPGSRTASPDNTGKKGGDTTPE